MPERFYRRRLPHWHIPGAEYFVTFRLNGSVPQAKAEEWRNRRAELLRMPHEGVSDEDHAITVDKKMFLIEDTYLDNHRDVHWLDDERIAKLVKESLYHGNGVTHLLHAYCIMPNHVHVLLTPLLPDTEHMSSLSRVLHGKKGHTGRESNRILGLSGQFWQDESYDHWVRDDDERERIIAYIRLNPVKAGLAEQPIDWLWGSCRDRFLMDGDRFGWLPKFTQIIAS